MQSPLFKDSHGLGYVPIYGRGGPSLKMYNLPEELLFGPNGPLSEADEWWVRAKVQTFCTFCHAPWHVLEGPEGMRCPYYKLLLSWQLTNDLQCWPSSVPAQPLDGFRRSRASRVRAKRAVHIASDATA